MAACANCVYFVWTLLFLLQVTPTTAWESGNSTCGVNEWHVPSPPEGANLLQVHAVIRHGDRTPWTGKLCWPNDDSKWYCNLNSAEIPIYSDTEYNPVVPRIHRLVFKIGNEVLNGNCSVGQLTTIGYQQQVKNGMVLKSAYVDSGFLDHKISTSEVYIRSDDVPRTLQSAQSLLWGMFPPSPGQTTEVVDIVTMDTMYDDIIPNPRLCPKIGVYEKTFNTSQAFKDHWNVTKTLLHDLSVAINYTISLADLDHFADCLRTHKCHHLAWPKGMTETLYNRAWAEWSWQSFNEFKYPSVQQNAQVGIGFLLKDIWKQMNASVQGKEVQKFFLYSGHDLTLITFLVALQVDNGAWPPYASTILMELYKVSSGSGHAVRLIYNGEVLQPPFCSGSISDDGLCDYKVFSEYFATITPTDPAVQCAV